jgi:multiple antibiotic resistance protein
MNIGLPAFRIAGGILLMLLSIDMVMARQTGLRATTAGEQEESTHRADISVFPLAIPLIAGPGALTSVVLLMGRADGDIMAQGLVLATLIAMLLITLACLLTASKVIRFLGVTGINVVSRVAGIVLAALAVQYVIDGVRVVLGA